MSGLTSYQRPAADGWRYSAGKRTRKLKDLPGYYGRPGSRWLVQKWDGQEWVNVGTAPSYAKAREL